ncbi:PD-(D/E)XK motif protein [Helicobacter ailurogastricus]|nr:PD-(D/E)XK motif protein [Helicobacter ailurogastricus]
MAETFPKITRASIDSRIINVKYTIDLLQCAEFLVADLTFEANHV